MYNFIVNVKSGKGNGNAVLKKILDMCYSKSIEYAIHITSAPEHATRLAAALSTNENNVIVAVGGDGTFHEILNGIVKPDKTRLGFIPSGRGNDYARSAMLSLKPEQAFADILNGKEIMTDYINVGNKRCLNIAGTGLDIDVLERVKGKTDKITYLLSLLHCIKNFVPYNVTVTHNGIATSYECVMIGICNGIAIGGNIRISPLSKINDGKLNAVILSMPENGKLLSVLPKVVKGKHMNLPITSHFLCDEISIDTHGRKIQLDGEIYSNVEFNCKVVKNGLRTFKPLNFIE